MDRQTLLELIDRRQDELYELLCRLIRINSENFGPYGNEADAAACIADLFRELGLETDLYSPLELEGFTEHPDYMDGRHLENRPNVTAVWKGDADENGLMLMGHSDTVPIGARSLWSFDPLIGEIRDGKIWGRGACDDKYAIAAGLSLFRLLKESGFRPRKNLLFTAYCDEEVGGSHGALASVLRYPAQRLVNLDCKDFEIWQAASGGAICEYRFRIGEALDSCKRTAEAIPVIMGHLERFAENRREELARNLYYGGTTIPDTSMRYLSVIAGGDSALNVGKLEFVFYTDRKRGEIEAELSAIDAAMKPRLEAMGIVSDGFRFATRFFHYGATDPGCEAITDLQRVAREVSGRELHPCGSCLSDLSIILANGGTDGFSFGIGRDFDVYGGAHQPDEHIGCAELLEFTKIIGAYILDVLG